MFGHVKAYYKNEIRCSICGEDAYRECNKLVTCRNCVRDHRFIARNCPVLLRNKKIKVITRIVIFLLQKLKN